MAEQGQCTATTKRGTRCQAAALPGKERCVFHADEMAERRQRGRKAGGKSTRRYAPYTPPVIDPNAPTAHIKTLEETAAYISKTITKVERGEIDSKTGHCLSGLIGNLIKILQPNDAAGEMLEMRREIEELKRHAHIGNGKARTQRTAKADRRAESQHPPEQPRPGDDPGGSGPDPLFGGDGT
jgi:hypothetical protein